MEISKMCFQHRVPPQMCIIMTSSKGRALYSLEGSMASRVSLALQVNLLRADWGSQRSEPAGLGTHPGVKQLGGAGFVVVGSAVNRT